MTTTDSDSSHGMLEVMRSPAFQVKAKAMLDYYLPIETDTKWVTSAGVADTAPASRHDPMLPLPRRVQVVRR